VNIERIVKENIYKNIILVILFGLLFFPIDSFLMNSSLVNDKPLAGDVLVAVSIFAVISCFGCFAYTYEKINQKSNFQRYLSHVTTGIYLLIIGTSLIFIRVLLSILMGPFILVDIMFILLYLACVGYDFWDLFRITNKQSIR